MDEQLVEAWRIHNRIGLYLLDGVAEEAFAVGKRKQGRGFAQMFAHIHGVRLTWLQVSAADLWEPLPRIARGDALDRERLRRALTASGAAVAAQDGCGSAATWRARPVPCSRRSRTSSTAAWVRRAKAR